MSSGDMRVGRRGPGWLAWAPWIVMAVGIVVMVVLFVIAVLALTGEKWDPGAGQPVRPAAAPAPTEFDQPTVEPSVSPSRSASATASARPAATASSARPSATTASPRPRITTPPVATPSATTGRPVLTGTYEAHDGGGLLVGGELRIRNSSDEPQRWTATLSFPDGAGELRGYWVDGGPKPNMTRTGDRYTFTDTIGPRRSIELRLYFSDSGRAADPVECTVNGTACVID